MQTAPESATTQAHALESAEIRQFAREGWVGPFLALSPAQAHRLCELRRRLDPWLLTPREMIRDGLQPPSGKVWSKSLHEISPEFFDAACHPAIVGRVVSILGPDVLLWGSGTTFYPPGGSHRWHVDVEHGRWRGVSVFVGLRNLTSRNTLKVVTGSHRFSTWPQDIGIADDIAAIRSAKLMDPQCELKAVNPGAGGAFIFDGPLWHGSSNHEAFEREALILQYCAPDQRVEVPLSWNRPFRGHPEKPACVLVAGSDSYGLNRLIVGARIPT